MHWLGRIFRRGNLYSELSEEVRAHLAEKTEQFMREGMSREEAQQSARRAFGNATLIEQRSREVWQWPTLESIWADVKYALRQLRRSPGFAAIAVLLLGLGIGATTAVFSLVNTVLLKPLPYPDPSRIVIPWDLPPPGVNIGGYDVIPWHPSRFHSMQQETRTYEYLAAFQGANYNLTGAGEPATLEGVRVTWGFFPALGITPHLGRIFTQQEDQPGREREVILSDSLWRNRFGADPGIVGHAIDLNGAPYTVTGVMPAGFDFPRASEMPGDFTMPDKPQIWVPAALPAITPPSTPSEMAIIGRLQPGVSLAQAQASMDLFTAKTDRLIPLSKGWNRSRVTPLRLQIIGDTRRPLLLMLSAVTAVLLIVCFNIASLLLTRSITRQREFTLRAALGAGRFRVLRQLLTESLLLALAGGALGSGIAVVGVWVVRVFGPFGIPRLRETTPDPRVFVFALAVSVLTGILFGLAPVFGATRFNLAESLRQGGQKSGSASTNPRLRNALVVSQIALALVLAVAAGLLVRSFYRLLAADPGFRAAHVLTFELSLPSSRYSGEQRIAQFYEQALPSLRAVAGVESAALTEAVPMGGATEATVFDLPDHPRVDPNHISIVNYTIVSPGFFSTIGTQFLGGRDIRDSDTRSSPPVAVINAEMARRCWPGQNAIGKQFIIPADRKPITIVGVVANLKHSSMREKPEPEMFAPYTQHVWPSMSIMQIVLRTRSAPDTIIGGIRAALHVLDPALPLANITTLTELTAETMAQDRFSMLLLDFFGSLALLLAAVGIYGVVSYSVGQRTREIGVRMALGAQRGNVFSMILGHGLRLAGAGVALGLIAAFAVGRLMAGFLYGVSSTDPLTFASVAGFLALIAVAAGFFPARRAASINPTEALRAE
jgi:putative ABC transport system permease protein